MGRRGGWNRINWEYKYEHIIPVMNQFWKYIPHYSIQNQDIHIYIIQNIFFFYNKKKKKKKILTLRRLRDMLHHTWKGSKWKFVWVLILFMWIIIFHINVIQILWITNHEALSCTYLKGCFSWKITNSSSLIMHLLEMFFFFFWGGGGGRNKRLPKKLSSMWATELFLFPRRDCVGYISIRWFFCYQHYHPQSITAKCPSLRLKMLHSELTMMDRSPLAPVFLSRAMPDTALRASSVMFSWHCSCRKKRDRETIVHT